MYRPLIRILSAAALTLMLVSCGSVSLPKYEKETPALDLRAYFNGPLEAWGMFQKRDGDIVKRFHVQITGTWQGDTGRLEENFTYSDGTTQQRIWNLTRIDEHRYEGTAADVNGKALGEVWGNTLRWQYVLRLPVDGQEYEVTFDDWMVLMDNEVLLNRSIMRKWGVELGQVTLAFRKTGVKP